MLVSVVVEGDTDLPFVRKLVGSVGLRIGLEIDAAGKGNIGAEWAGYNAAAKGSPWFVLRDLDSDADCAPALLSALEYGKDDCSRWMRTRIAVREVESWLLADRDAVAEFFAVRASQVPDNPDSDPDPTRTLVNICRHSRKSVIKRGMVPRSGTGAAVGPLYESLVIQFGRENWDVTKALSRSDSLRRAQTALSSLARDWAAFISGPP